MNSLTAVASTTHYQLTTSDNEKSCTPFPSNIKVSILLVFKGKNWSVDSDFSSWFCTSKAEGSYLVKGLCQDASSRKSFTCEMIRRLMEREALWYQPTPPRLYQEIVKYSNNVTSLHFFSEKINVACISSIFANCQKITFPFNEQCFMDAWNNLKSFLVGANKLQDLTIHFKHNVLPELWRYLPPSCKKLSVTATKGWVEAG